VWADVLRFLALSIVVAGFAIPGCASEEIHADHHDHEPTGQVSAPLAADATVADAVAEACETTVVKGLATQLVEEIQCLRPGTMKRIDNVAGVNLGPAAFPFLQTPAADALVAVQGARGATLTINSGLRTLPQQYLLYRWYKTGRCNIGLAATPGTSNHESAIAVDVADNAAWRTAMQGQKFRWLGAGDPMHYDFTGTGSVDIKGLSVQAFQRLWNRNHPEDQIAVDGQYGTETESHLSRAPANGFAIGAKCDEPAPAETAPAPPITDVPEQPDAIEAEEDEPTTSAQKTTSTSKGSKSTGDDDDDDDDDSDARRERADAASAGCSMHASSTSESAWFALLGIAFVIRKAARRRAR
jgi:hypothetical protein